MHIKDVLLGRIIENCKPYEACSQPGTAIYALSRELRTDILKRREQELRECPMACVFAQVATLLSPCYKLMNHMRHLSSYKYTDMQALLVTASLLRTLHPDIFENTSSLSIRLDDNRKRRKVHALLLPSAAEHSHVSYE